MKIVHVISCLTKGGGERIVAELANEAVKQGDEVAIIAAWPEDPVLLLRLPIRLLYAPHHLLLNKI